MLDRGAHSGRGLDERETAAFNSYQEKARREYVAMTILRIRIGATMARRMDAERQGL